MKYESTILKRLIDTYGVVGNPRYISEIIKEFIVRGKERFPELFTYQADWLAHIDEFGLNPTYTVSYTGQSIYAPNTLERPVKSAILSGSTKYRDIDSGEFLESFEEGRNLELVSVKMPVLTTSNEDGTKTNILSTPSDLELRGIGDVQDELNLLTGELTQRIGEVVLDGTGDWQGFMLDTTNNKATARLHLPDSDSIVYNTSSDVLISDKLKNSYWKVNKLEVNSVFRWDSPQPIIGITLSLDNDINTFDKFKSFLSKNPVKVYYQRITPPIKTVELTILDQNGQNVKHLMSFNGGTHFNTTSLEGSPLPVVSVSVETDLEEILMVCSLEGNTL